MIDTTNSRSIENLIQYFQRSMKGMKSVEFRIWERSYSKHKGDFKKLEMIQKQMRYLRAP